MAKVLYVSLPLPEHVNPTLGLIKELINRGEEVVYYSGREFRDRIENTGASFKEYRQKIDHHDVHHGEDFWESMSSAVENPLQVFYMLALGCYYRTQGMIENNLELFLAERAAYIIHDTCICYKELPHRLGIPAIASIPVFYIGPSLIHTDPAAYIKGSVGTVNKDFLHKYQKNQLMRMIELLNAKFQMSVKDTNYHLLDVLSGCEDLNLVYSTKDFLLYPDSFDNSYCFVGRCADNHEDCADFPYHKLDGRPLIQISPEIFNHHKDILNACLRALEDKPFQMVIEVGDRFPEQIPSMPESAVICRFTSPNNILKRAHMRITTGGADSVLEAAENGVPLIVIPQSGDQFIGAETVEKYQAGIYLKSPALTVEAIGNAVLNIENDPKYRNNIAKVGCSLRLAGGAKKAADEIFAFKQSVGL